MDLQSWHREILAAYDRVKNHVRHTPLEYSLFLSEKADKSKVYIKLESEQLTGAFKVRGAFNKLSKLKEENIKKELYTASSGNHGLACLAAMKTFGMHGKIFLQEEADKEKIELLRQHGGELVLHGHDCLEAELEGRRRAQVDGAVYVSPYNDADIAAGQGTIGVEILKDLPDVDAVIVPVGGGGLIGGIAAYLKAAKPDVKIYGCSATKSKVMHESVKQGKIIFEESYETLSNGTAGGIEENTLTFPLCCDYVDEWILVDEDDIAAALYFMIDKHHKIVEGAAGLSIGAFVTNADKFKGQNVAIVSCGSNISVQNIKSIIDKYKK